MDKCIPISQEERRQGLYIIGTSGTGKSTLLDTLILRDIMQGMGVCLIEPHGDLTNTVIAGIPGNRLEDVILLDLADTEFPFGLNLFHCNELRNIREVTKTADFVQHVFEKIWGVGPPAHQVGCLGQSAEIFGFASRQCGGTRNVRGGAVYERHDMGRTSRAYLSGTE